MDDDDDDSQLNHNLCAIVIATIDAAFRSVIFPSISTRAEIIQFLNCYDFDFDSQSIVIVYNMEMLFSSFVFT